MKAITLYAGKLGLNAARPEPVRKPGEVLVEIEQAGICETDLQLAQGYMGFEGILGHEFVGIASEGKFSGKRVVGEINCACRDCDTCLAGRPTHCPHRTVVGIDRHDGAFAPRLAIPETNLHEVPDSLETDAAVFVEPLAAAFQIVDQVPIALGDRVAILGDGRLGFLSAQVLRLSTENVTVFGKHPSKLGRFETFAKTIQIESPDEDFVSEGLFDVVVDCTGSTTGLPMAIRLARPRGTIVLKTTVANEHQQSLAAIVIHELRVVGSRCGPFDKALRALAEGAIDVSGLVTHRFSLEQVDVAFKAAVSPDAFKVVFEIG
ncbi:MAG: alcohol dehydrogenase catalytic domain-containing protein [Planctomycetota bacterium]